MKNLIRVGEFTYMYYPESGESLRITVRKVRHTFYVGAPLQQVLSCAQIEEVFPGFIAAYDAEKSATEETYRY